MKYTSEQKLVANIKKLATTTIDMHAKDDIRERNLAQLARDDSAIMIAEQLIYLLDKQAGAKFESGWRERLKIVRANLKEFYEKPRQKETVTE